MNRIVSVKDLGFRYNTETTMCLQNLYLEITEGSRFGLFGPNGAGKTTLLHLLTGVLKYQSGSINILGYEVSDNNKNLNRQIGFVPQDYSFYPELSPVENLEFFGAWAGLNKNEIREKTNELLSLLGLDDVRNKPVRYYSGGMKRRVNLAIGVIHRPRILFLDEPTVGVDIQSRHAILKFLLKLNSEGTTLVYTSHQLNEAQELCDVVAFIDHGKIIAQSSPDELIALHNESDLEGLFIRLTGKEYRDK